MWTPLLFLLTALKSASSLPNPSPEIFLDKNGARCALNGYKCSAVGGRLAPNCCEEGSECMPKHEHFASCQTSCPDGWLCEEYGPIETNSVLPSAMDRRTRRKESENNPYGIISPSCSSDDGNVMMWSSWYTGDETNIEDEVVIPCGTTVKIDAGKSLNFQHGLTVKGKLQFEDGADTTITSTFIVVRGYFQVGSETSPRESKLKIILVDDAEKNVFWVEDENFKNPRRYGRKTFVVIGGSVEMYGGGVTGPTHTRLALDSLAGSTTLEVEEDVTSSWKVGDSLVITSGGSNRRIESEVTIASDPMMSNGMTRIEIDEGLKYKHVIKKYTTESGRDIFVKPEVAKLSRNIVITTNNEGETTNEKNETEYIGGNLIISHSSIKQVIQGVEFVFMGQSGTVGKYPIYFLFNGRTHPDSLVSRNSIHDSFNRCVVIRATHDLTVTHNVAFKNRGHCYATEDGIEVGNTFAHNIAIETRNPSSFPKNVTSIDSRSDRTTCAFRLANPNNNLHNNVVAGASYCGYWYESESHLKGASRDKSLGPINPQVQPIGRFDENSVHAVQYCLIAANSNPESRAMFESLECSDAIVGFYSNKASNLGLKGAVVANVQNGVVVSESNGFKLEDSLIIGNYAHGESNYGMNISSNVIPYKKAMKFHFDQVTIEGFSKGIIINADLKRVWPDNSFMNKVTFGGSVDNPFVISETAEEIVAIQMGSDGVSVSGGSSYSDGYLVHKVSNTTSTCTDASNLSPSLLFCAGQCWRQLNLEYVGPEEFQIKHVETGVSWAHTTEKRRNSHPEERRLRLTAPAGSYEFTLVNSTGSPVSAADMPGFSVIKADTFYNEDVCGQTIDFVFTNCNGRRRSLSEANGFGASETFNC